MSLNLLNKLSRCSIIEYPFPHVIIHDALDDDLYSELVDTFPEDFMLSKSPYVLNDRGHTRRFPQHHFQYNPSLNSIWRSFADENTSASFFRAITSFFLEPSISRIFPTLLEKISFREIVRRKPLRLDTLPDPSDKGKCLTDFQLVANLPVSNAHTSRSPHLDNPSTIYTILFYMRDRNDDSIGGGLDLYASNHLAASISHGKGRSIDPKYLTKTKTLHYSSNTAILFLNTPKSYHSVQPIYLQKSVRKSINIIGELPLGGSLFPVKTD